MKVTLALAGLVLATVLGAAPAAAAPGEVAADTCAPGGYDHWANLPSEPWQAPSEPGIEPWRSTSEPVIEPWRAT
jgi:hypothetical protein